MHNFIKVDGEKSLVRDSITGAILDVDKDSYNQYKLMKHNRKNQIMKIDNIENRINNLESDISEIKNLLQELIRK